MIAFKRGKKQWHKMSQNMTNSDHAKNILRNKDWKKRGDYNIGRRVRKKTAIQIKYIIVKFPTENHDTIEHITEYENDFENRYMKQIKNSTDSTSINRVSIIIMSSLPNTSW